MLQFYLQILHSKYFLWYTDWASFSSMDNKLDLLWLRLKADKELLLSSDQNLAQ